MADIPTCVVTHLHADATIGTLLGDRVYHETQVPATDGASVTVPDITVICEGGFEGEHRIVARWRIRFNIRAGKDARGDLPAIEDRLRVLFNDATNYTLGSGTTAFCVISDRVQTPEQRHDDELGYWTSESVYEFTVLDAVT